MKRQSQLKKTRAKFVLVEPISLELLVDRPSLACAVLIGACISEGIETVLIQGQTKIYDFIFSKGLIDLWDLMKALDEKSIDEMNLPVSISSLLEKGFPAFEEEMVQLYRSMILEKNSRDYLSGDRLNQFINTTLTIGKIYHHFLGNPEFKSCTLVDLYVDEILQEQPGLIGFSMHASFDPLTRAIRKKLKSRSDIPIIVGGALLPHLRPEDFIEIARKECTDYLFVGMAEDNLPSLIHSLTKNGSSSDIPGVYKVKDESLSGLPLTEATRPRPLFFPDFSQFDLDKYPSIIRILPMVTAYGCTWRKCSFCSHHFGYSANYNVIPVDHVIKTIIHLKEKYHCTHFSIYDDELPPGRARKLSKELLSLNVNNVHFFAYGRLSKGYDDQALFLLMKQAGFAAMCWGMESGSQKILDSMNKNTDITTMKSVLNKSHSAGIGNLCFIMFGFPGEEPKHADETTRFLEENSTVIDCTLAGTFRLDETSPIARNPSKWGLQKQEDGTWLIKHGMSEVESKAYFKQFTAEKNAHYRDNSGTQLFHLPKLRLIRMLHFVKSAGNIISLDKILLRLNAGQFNQIYPLLLGTLEKETLQTIDTALSFKTNHFEPLKPVKLTPLEAQVFHLSDGKRSVEEILNVLIPITERKERQQEGMEDLSIKFLISMFQGRHGLGFSKTFP